VTTQLRPNFHLTRRMALVYISPLKKTLIEVPKEERKLPGSQTLLGKKVGFLDAQGNN